MGVTIDDPIHGVVYIPEPIKYILNSPQVQRLRDLHQLGVASYVYPAATHTRFEHSVGCMHLAMKQLDMLVSNHRNLGIPFPYSSYPGGSTAGCSPSTTQEPFSYQLLRHGSGSASRKRSRTSDSTGGGGGGGGGSGAHVGDWSAHEDPKTCITQRDRICVGLAGLCHDIGHGPFSHTFEGLVNEERAEDARRKRAAKLLAAGRSDDEVGDDDDEAEEGGDAGKLEHWEHEEMGLKLFDAAWERVKGPLQSFGFDHKDRNFVKLLISGLHHSKPFPSEDVGRPPWKRFMVDIVANKLHGFDVDKLDYLQRDGFFVGNRELYVDRIFLNAYVLPVKQSDPWGKGAHEDTPDGQYRICYSEKVLANVSAVFSTRRGLHCTVYQHRVVLIVNRMVKDVLRLCRHVCFIRHPLRGDEVEYLTLPEAARSESAFARTGDWILHYLRNMDVRHVPLHHNNVAAATSSDVSHPSSPALRQDGGEDETLLRNRCATAQRILDRLDRRDMYLHLIHIYCETEAEKRLAEQLRPAVMSRLQERNLELYEKLRAWETANGGLDALCVERCSISSSTKEVERELKDRQKEAEREGARSPSPQPVVLKPEDLITLVDAKILQEQWRKASSQEQSSSQSQRRTALVTRSGFRNNDSAVPRSYTPPYHYVYWLCRMERPRSKANPHDDGDDAGKEAPDRLLDSEVDLLEELLLACREEATQRYQATQTGSRHSVMRDYHAGGEAGRPRSPSPSPRSGGTTAGTTAAGLTPSSLLPSSLEEEAMNGNADGELLLIPPRLHSQDILDRSGDGRGVRETSRAASRHHSQDLIRPQQEEHFSCSQDILADGEFIAAASDMPRAASRHSQSRC